MKQFHGARSAVALFLCLALSSPGIAMAQEPAPRYKLTIVEDASTSKRVKKGRVSSQAVVKVTDQNDVPVPAIAITFLIPQGTGGAAFASGGLSSIATTNAAGIASSGSFSAAAGSSFNMSASAAVPGGNITIPIPRNNSGSGCCGWDLDRTPGGYHRRRRCRRGRRSRGCDQGAEAAAAPPCQRELLALPRNPPRSGTRKSLGGRTPVSYCFGGHRVRWAFPIACFLGSGAGVLAQTNSPGWIAAPLAGLLADQELTEIRAIQGVPGSSTVSGPIALPSGVLRVHLAPAQGWALVEQAPAGALGLMPFNGMTRRAARSPSTMPLRIHWSGHRCLQSGGRFRGDHLQPARDVTDIYRSQWRPASRDASWDFELRRDWSGCRERRWNLDVARLLATAAFICCHPRSLHKQFSRRDLRPESDFFRISRRLPSWTVARRTFRLSMV